MCCLVLSLGTFYLHFPTCVSQLHYACTRPCDCERARERLFQVKNWLICMLLILLSGQRVGKREGQEDTSLWDLMQMRCTRGTDTDFFPGKEKERKTQMHFPSVTACILKARCRAFFLSSSSDMSRWTQMGRPGKDEEREASGSQAF